MLVGIKVCVALILCIGSTSVWASTSCNAEGKLVCMNCGQVGKCTGSASNTTSAPSTTSATTVAVGSRAATEYGVVAEGNPCTESQACLEIFDTAVCVSVASTSCDNCNGQPTACDPYNKTIVQACRSGKTPVQVQVCVNATCKAGECVSVSTPTIDPADACSGVTGSKYVTVKPTCNVGVLCIDNSVANIIQCPEGQYFDLKSFKCKTLPINLCGGQGDGFFSHPTDCTKGVICSGGTLVAIQSCLSTEFYDATARGCKPKAGVVTCPIMDGCTFEPIKTTPTNGTGSNTTPISQAAGSTSTSSQAPGSTSTSSQAPVSTSTPAVTPTRPPTCSASNVDQRYPYTANCKKYWTCRKVSASSYQYQEGTCIGSLVFNPVTKYCDVATAVPGC